MTFNSYPHTDEKFKFKDDHLEGRGKYKVSQTLDYESIEYSPSLDYEIEIDGKILRPGNVSKEEMLNRQKRNPRKGFCWRWSRNLYEFGLREGFVVLKESKGNFRIYTKTYKNVAIEKISGQYKIIEKNRDKKISSLQFVNSEYLNDKFVDNKYSNDNSRKDIRKLFERKVFEYSKPVSLIKECAFIGTNERDIILDFFAGSATTAHAVMKLNAEDGGNRRFIMVQLPEICDEKSEGFEAGYRNIAEIGKERIRRAGKKIKEENVDVTANLDIGFRVLKIDTSNMVDVENTPDAIEQGQLSSLIENIKLERTSEDLLFQVLLNWGVDLTLPITTETVEALEVFFVDKSALVACFERPITEELCKKLANRKPLRVVFRDSGFENDSVKVNVEQIFKLLSPDTDVKTI